MTDEDDLLFALSQLAESNRQRARLEVRIQELETVVKRLCEYLEWLHSQDKLDRFDSRTLEWAKERLVGDQ